MKEIAIVEHSVEKAHIWLQELAEELGTDDRQRAYRVLRASLHVSFGELEDVRAVLPAELRVVLS